MLVNSNGDVINPPIVIDDIQYPPNCEAVFSDAELAAIGLFRVTDNGPPPNTLVKSFTPTKQPNGSFVMVYSTVPLSPQVPPSISARQFWQQLAVAGFIQNAEALAAMSNTLPAALTSLLKTLPPAEQFTIQMNLTANNPSLLRSDAILSQVEIAFKMKDTDMDQVFISGALL